MPQLRLVPRRRKHLAARRSRNTQERQGTRKHGIPQCRKYDCSLHAHRVLLGMVAGRLLRRTVSRRSEYVWRIGTNLHLAQPARRRSVRRTLPALPQRDPGQRMHPLDLALLQEPSAAGNGRGHHGKREENSRTGRRTDATPHPGIPRTAGHARRGSLDKGLRSTA